jgi:hypothetical protein
LPGANTLGYFVAAFVMKKSFVTSAQNGKLGLFATKVFLTKTPGACTINVLRL